MERAEIAAAIGEVARKHNLLLSPDDPILVVVTVNEMILGRLLKQQQEALEAALSQMSAGAAQQVEAARDLAGVVITGGANYVAAEIRGATAALKTELLAAVEQAKAEANGAAASAKQAERRSWQIALGVAVILSLLLGIAVAPFVLAPDPPPVSRPAGNTTARR